MADDRIIIQIELDDGTVRDGFLKIQNQAEETGKKVGESLQSEGVSKFGTALVGVAAAFAAFEGVKKVFDVVREGVAEAVESERLFQNLNVALANAGQFSAEAASKLERYVSGIEATTRFTDEQVTSAASLIETLGRLDAEGLQRATDSALNLSAALGIDLDTAARLVGKAATGNVESFSRFGLVIEKGKTSAETFSNALNQIEQRFGGTAQAQVNTFGGVVELLGKSFENVRKAIGSLITSSPTLIAVIKATSEFFFEASGQIKQFGAQGDIFAKLIPSIIEFARALNVFIVVPITIVANVINTAFELIRSSIQAVFLGLVASTTRLVGFFNDAFGIGGELLTTLETFEDAASETMNRFATSTLDRITGVFDTAAADNITSFLNKIDDATRNIKPLDPVQNRIDQFQNPLEEVAKAAEKSAATVKKAVDEVKDTVIVGLDSDGAFGAVIDGAKDKITELARTAKQGFADVGASALIGLGRSAGNAFAAFGKALVEGKNAFAEFTKALIAGVGQAAIALGTEFILRGVAYLFVPGLQAFGPPLIGAGAALAAFGGVLSAIGGGGGGGVSTASGASAAGNPSTGSSDNVTTTEATDLNVNQQKQSQISINVQGDVLDSRDTGLRIVDILRDFTDKNGATIA